MKPLAALLATLALCVPVIVREWNQPTTGAPVHHHHHHHHHRRA